MRKFEVLIILLTSLFVSCGSFLLPELQVVDFSYDNEKLCVVFSAAPDSISVQNSFSLSEDESEVDGIYKFDGSMVYFYPKKGIQDNYDYLLVISNSCEDKKGISLMDKYVKSFSTRAETVPPQITSVTPADNSQILTNEEFIEVRFSEPVIKTTFESALSITPSFEYILEFNNTEDVVKIIPKSNLKNNTNYKLLITKDLMDKSRNNLLKEYITSFSVDKNYDTPVLDAKLTNEKSYSLAVSAGSSYTGIPTDVQLKIDFSTQMSLNSLNSAISITPSLSYTTKKDELNSKWCSIIFTDPKWGETYTVNISNKICDVYSNSIGDDVSYTLTFDAEESRKPEFIEGYIQTGIWTDSNVSADDFVLISKNTNYSGITFDETFYHDDKGYESILYLVFGSSKDSTGIDMYSLMDKFSISATNSCASIVIKKISKVENSEINNFPINEMWTSNVTGSELTISVFKYELEITNALKNGIIQFEIDSGITDSLGNSSKENYIFKYNK